MAKQPAKQPTSLKKPYQDILRAQAITEDSPGTILKDFDILLDFIGPEGMETSGTYHFLPMKLLPDLNAHLSRPIEIDLKRPQQKSYPHIHGLYLLLRAGGLACIQQSGKKYHLRLDEQGLASWHSLNPTERYFTLFESWLLRGDPSILGEHGFYGSGGIQNWPAFFQRVTDRVLQVAGNPAAESFLPYSPSLCTLALLELFGFVKVRHAKPEPGKGWRLESIERTELGEAMLALLFEEEFFLDVLFAPPEEETTTNLQSKLVPFFPEWRHNLALSQPERLTGVYIFKVSLGPSVWARIAIPSNSPMDDLSAAILNAYKFDFDHLYRFTYTNRYGSREDINHPYMDEPPLADEVTPEELSLTPGTVITYLYDFGDNWKFEVLLERIEPADKKLKRAKLLEFHGKRPPQYGNEEDW